MNAPIAFLLLGLLAAANAAPWPNSVPVCAEECPMLDSSKLKYMTDKTYVYDYTGTSKIELIGIEGGVTETQWKKKVLLSWLSPCEMAITFQDIKVDGTTPKDKAVEVLSKYPLVVAVTDGRVQRVCTHPQDDVWSINIKKGVASAFQNSIPLLSPLSSELNVTETDVVGKCPTRYEVQGQGENVVVKKNKDLRQCQHRFPTPTESPSNWLKSPVPIERHWTDCKQEIRNGIYTKITCEDQNVIRPFVGAIRYIRGLQESTLQFVSENGDAPESLSTIRGEYGFESLLYNHAHLLKDQTKVPLLDAKLTEICEKTKESVKHEAAPIMHEIIHLLKRVPDNVVQQTLQKIRSGQFCQQKERLENLFLDAIAFTYDSGSVKTMVEELLHERAHGGRDLLYAAAFYFTAHPNIQAVEAVGELFKSDKYMPSVFLSAGTMINKFCKNYNRQHDQHYLQQHGCHTVPQVRVILEYLHSKLQLQCKVCDDDKTKESAFATLEAIGNIGIVTPEIAKTTLKCIETRGVDASVHVAALRSFRNAKCQQFATMNLVNIAVDPQRDTEVRISSYLAAMRCVTKMDLEEIVYKISKENSTQVRSFVFSHLLNIQESTAPGKAHLRYLLTNFVIPEDFGKDFRRHSRNIDLSFYAPSIKLGGGMESNIIYTPGSFVPRSVSFNFSSIFYGQRINLGEFGTRLEGVDEIISHLIGPSSPIHKHSMETIMQKVSDFIKEKGSSILEHFMGNSRPRRSLDVTQVAEMLKKVYNEGKLKVPRAEVYASIMGQDIAYKFMKGNLHNLDFNRIFDSYFSKLKEVAAHLKNMQSDFARTTKLSWDYRLATIQGVPLRIKFAGIAVLGMKMEGRMDLWNMMSNPGNSENNMTLIPSLSVLANGFVGYDCLLARTGLKMNNTISTNGGITVSVKTVQSREAEIHIDLPEDMDLINVESEVYLMKKKIGEVEHIIKPSSVHDVRIRQRSCFNELERMLGLKICYDVDVPDVFRSTGLPLGAKSIVKLYVEKADHSLKGYIVKAEMLDNQESKVMKVKMETTGSSNPKTSEATLALTNNQDITKVKATVEGPGIKGKAWAHLKSHEDEDEFEIFGEYESSERQLSQGFKYKRTSTSSGSARMTDVVAFVSQDKSFPPNSKVFSINFISRQAYRGSNIALIMKTENALRHIVALTFETGFDLDTPYNLKIPIPKKLRRLEVHLDTLGWKMNAFVRQERESQEDSVSKSSLKIWHRSREILVYEATHTLSENSEHQYNKRNEIKLKFGESAYKIDQQTLFTHQRKGVILKITPLSEGSYILDFEATLANSQEGHTVLFLVDTPTYMRPIKFELKMISQGEAGKYELDLFLEHGNQKAFELRGPTTLIAAEELNKVETSLEVNVLGRHLYKLQTHFEFSREKIIVLFDLANDQESLLLIEWKVGAKSLQQSHIVFRVDITKFTKHKIDVITKPGKVEIIFDNLILPHSSHQRRVKGSIDVLYLENKCRVEFAWDADREPNQKFILDSHMMMNPSQPGFSSIDSQLHYGGNTYMNRIEMHGEYFIHPSHGRNGIKFILTNAEHKTYIIEFDSKLENKGSQIKLDLLTSYKSPEEHEYKFSNILEMDKLSGNDNFQINSELRYVAQQRESRLHFRMKRNSNSDSKTDYDGEVLLDVPGVRPVGLTFLLNRTPVLWKNNLMLKTTSPEALWDVNVEVYPHGLGLRTFDFKIDMSIIAQFLKDVRQLTVKEGEKYSDVNSSLEENEMSGQHSTVRPWGSHSQEEMGGHRSTGNAWGGNSQENEMSGRHSRGNAWGGSSQEENEMIGHHKKAMGWGGSSQEENDMSGRRNRGNAWGGNSQEENEMSDRHNKENAWGGNSQEGSDMIGRQNGGNSRGGNSQEENEMSGHRKKAMGWGGSSQEENNVSGRRNRGNAWGGNSQEENEMSGRHNKGNAWGGNSQEGSDMSGRHNKGNAWGGDFQEENEMIGLHNWGRNSQEGMEMSGHNNRGKTWGSGSQERIPRNSEENDRNGQYHWRYHSPSPSSRTMMFKSPERTMECGCQFNPTSINAWFYPDKEKSDAKYDVTVHSHGMENSGANGRQHEWKGRISHPEFDRDKEVTLFYASIGPLKSGSLEIDILPDTADKVTATLSSNITTQNSMRIEATLVSRIFNTHPKLTVMSTYSPQVIGFDLSYHNSPSSEAVFMMAGKYDNTTNKNVAISFKIKNKGQSVFELSTIMQPELQQPECYGWKIKGGVRTPTMGRYDIKTRLCGPAYIEFTSRKHQSPMLYTTKLGLQYPNKAEVSLCVEDEHTQRTRNALLARAKLTSPTLLKLDFDYEPQEVDMLLNDLREKLDEVVSPVSSWIEIIKETLQEQARAKGFEFPSKEFMRDWNTVKEESGVISLDLKLRVLSLYNQIRHILHNPTVSYITHVYQHVWLKMAEVHRDFRVALTWTLLHISEEFSDVFTPIGHTLRELAHMMTDRQEPEFIRRLWQDFEESWMYRAVREELDSLRNKYPEQYHAMEEVWRKINNAVMVDLEKLRVKLMEQPPMKALVHWVKQDLKADHIAKLIAEKIISFNLQEILYVTVEKQSNHLQLEIPIRMPVHSLTQLLQISKPYPTDMTVNIIWSFDTYITRPIQSIIGLRHIPSPFHITEWLPPFNGTAVVASNSEILTYDGKIIRIPQTPCRIRLVTTGHTRLTMEHAQHDQHPIITLTHFTVKAVVNPDFSVKLNGQEVHDRSTVMGVEVKVNGKEVMIRSPFLTVRVLKNSRVLLVTASGWAFGKTAGVLGTFDGEIENDMLMPTGVKATNAREFVTSWQEDHNCQTPELTPLHVPFSRVVECHTLVGTRSRCNPIVNPKPFVRMCQEALHACDAAKAYRTLCHHKGVREPYPLPC